MVYLYADDYNVVKLFDPEMVQVNHVICTNTNHVQSTWFNRIVPRICLSNVSMRHVLLSMSFLMFILLVFHCHERRLNCCETTSSSISDVIPGWCK
jgi:hypothetical protein